ncbi:MAG: hypothetical protein JWQ63_3074 [Mucilaginibacter sp.]|nr:hypothetical protein [Mucilaginibacter sp.]
MKIKTAVFFLCVILFSCSKDNNPNVILNGTLTNCPINATCTYNYYEGADFTGYNQLVRGNYRVFAYNSLDQNSCGPNTLLYFKISLSNNYFDISSSQIAKGQLTAYIDNCPCCMYFTQVGYAKPIGGEIKGKKTDANHWLINAAIIFGNTSNNAPVDTLIVNQYYTLTKLP